MTMNTILSDEQEKAKLTKDILYSVSKHLSGRVDCRGVEYAVTIGHETFDDLVTLEPVKFVFPTRYRRCERDKVPVMSHVIKEHFPSLYNNTDGMYGTHIDTSKLVKGVYVYQSSVDSKRRRWVRVK